MDTKEHFYLLYESLKDIYKVYTENVMKTLASLVIAIGWILTSETSQKWFINNETIRYFSLIIISLLIFIQIRLSYIQYSFSQKKISLLAGLNYVSSEYYANYQITLTRFILGLIMNLSISLFIFVMILTKFSYLN